MKLKIQGTGELERFVATVNGETKQFVPTNDFFGYCVDFDLVQQGNYDIIIEEIPETNLMTFKDVAFSILFFPILLVLESIQQDGSAWWQEVKPFCIKFDFNSDIYNNKVIEFEYVVSHYDKSERKWMLPKISMNENDNLHVDYTLNKYAFKNAFLKSCYEIGGAFLLLLIGFIVLLYFSIEGTFDLKYLSIILIFCSVVAPIIILKIYYEKMKKMEKLFFKYKKG